MYFVILDIYFCLFCYFSTIYLPFFCGMLPGTDLVDALVLAGLLADHPLQ